MFMPSGPFLSLLEIHAKKSYEQSTRILTVLLVTNSENPGFNREVSFLIMTYTCTITLPPKMILGCLGGSVS